VAAPHSPDTLDAKNDIVEVIVRETIIAMVTATVWNCVYDGSAAASQLRA
jgi:hypothetical protein